MCPRLTENRVAHLPKREIEVCHVGSCSAEALPQGCQTVGVDMHWPDEQSSAGTSVPLTKFSSWMLRRLVKLVKLPQPTPRS